jgi:hypothetical protein
MVGTLHVFYGHVEALRVMDIVTAGDIDLFVSKEYEHVEPPYQLAVAALKAALTPRKE